MPAVADRCRRCATKMRNTRTVCPSCGYDFNAPEVSDPNAPAPVQQIKKVSAKAGVKICPICMESVAENELMEQDGQKICANCSENLKKKAMKKAAGGGGPPK